MGGNGGEKEDKSDGTKDGNGKVNSSPAKVKCEICNDDVHKVA